jgi:hypothetical protein
MLTSMYCASEQHFLKGDNKGWHFDISCNSSWQHMIPDLGSPVNNMACNYTVISTIATKSQITDYQGCSWLLPLIIDQHILHKVQTMCNKLSVYVSTIKSWACNIQNQSIQIWCWNVNSICTDKVSCVPSKRYPLKFQLGQFHQWVVWC